AFIALLAEDPRAVEILVSLFSTSQYFSELLIRSPDWLSWLRSGAERRDRSLLVEDFSSELGLEPDPEARRLLLRRFRHREMLRSGENDIVGDRALETTTLDLSHLAEACIEVAYRLAMANAVARLGTPMGEGGTPARFVVLGLGKLGGEELNYSSDIDLIFLYD